MHPQTNTSRRKPKAYTDRICAQCNQPFRFPTAWLPRHAMLCCSKPCAYAYRTRPVQERFWERVQKTDTCWLWTGATEGFGYGMIGLGAHKSNTMRTHRFSWELHYGPIPDGMFVCHRCDNPPCVRPDHLFLDTNSGNIHDMYDKGRDRVTGPRPTVKGEGNHKAKLSAEQVTFIRSAYAAGSTITALGRDFGVHSSTVYAIVTRQTWKHIGTESNA